MKFGGVAVCTVLCLGLLGGCEDRKQMWRQSEIEDIASDVQGDLSSTIDENAAAGNRLVERVDQLETENRQLESEIRTLEADLRSTDANLRSFIDHHNSESH